MNYKICFDDVSYEEAQEIERFKEYIESENDPNEYKNYFAELICDNTSNNLYEIRRP